MSRRNDDEGKDNQDEAALPMMIVFIVFLLIVLVVIVAIFAFVPAAAAWLNAV